MVSKCGGHWFYFDVNPFYVDTLDKKVIADFIDNPPLFAWAEYENALMSGEGTTDDLEQSEVKPDFIYDSIKNVYEDLIRD